MIISKHMDALLSVNAVTADYHLRDLRRLYDQSETYIRSLKAEPESYGSMFFSVLLSKLPPELRLLVSPKVSVSTEGLDIEGLLRTFEQELTARERASGPSQPSRRSQSQGQSATSAFVATVPGSPACVFCEQSHPSASCTTVTELNDRKKILRSSGRCFNCLRKNHIFKNYRSTTKCKTCHGKHHTSICDKKRETGSLATPTDLNPEAPAFNPTPTHSAVCTSTEKAVLLQTGCTQIFNPSNPSQDCEVWVLFASGSQKSYLTDRAMRLLQLKPVGEQTQSIAAIGARRGQVKVCPIVLVCLCLKGYPNVCLPLHVVTTICEPLSCQPITASVESCDYLLGPDLADSAKGDSLLLIDVLIGCDHYWKLVTGGVCRGEKGPTAIHTKLGWILSGPTATTSVAVHSPTCILTTHTLRDDSVPAEQTFFESLGINEDTL